LDRAVLKLYGATYSRNHRTRRADELDVVAKAGVASEIKATSKAIEIVFSPSFFIL